MIVLTENGTTGELRFAYPGEREIVGKVFRIRAKDENGNPLIVKDKVIDILVDDAEEAGQ